MKQKTSRLRKKFYFAHPEVWEAGNADRFKGEAKFLDAVFKKYGKVKEVLDVGCGTGGHAQQLCARGYNVLGIDLSQDMIRFAKTKRPKLAFAVGDMRRLPDRNKFDAAISLCTTFSYNVTNEEVVASLRALRLSLRKKGLLIIECFNPIAFIDGISFKKVVAERKRFSALGLWSENEHRVDHLNQVLIEKRTMRRLSGGSRVQTDVSRLRMFFPQELRYFLETSGFELLRFYVLMGCWASAAHHPWRLERLLGVIHRYLAGKDVFVEGEF